MVHGVPSSAGAIRRRSGPGCRHSRFDLHSGGGTGRTPIRRSLPRAAVRPGFEGRRDVLDDQEGKTVSSPPSAGRKITDPPLWARVPEERAAGRPVRRVPATRRGIGAAPRTGLDGGLGEVLRAAKYASRPDGSSDASAAVTRPAEEQQGVAAPSHPGLPSQVGRGRDGRHVGVEQVSCTRCAVKRDEEQQRRHHGAGPHFEGGRSGRLWKPFGCRRFAELRKRPALGRLGARFGPLATPCLNSLITEVYRIDARSCRCRLSCDWQ